MWSFLDSNIARNLNYILITLQIIMRSVYLYMHVSSKKNIYKKLWNAWSIRYVFNFIENIFWCRNVILISYEFSKPILLISYEFSKPILFMYCLFYFWYIVIRQSEHTGTVYSTYNAKLSTIIRQRLYPRDNKICHRSSLLRRFAFR